MSPRETPWGTYTQIAETLRERVTSGELAPGAPVSSESALADEFSVARSTIRRALAKLEADGLIRSIPGTGRVVCDPAASGQDAQAPSRPRYRRIVAELRTRIEDGDLQPGDPLPSESALVQQYGVSRTTARQALSELEGVGLIRVVHGVGRFVQGRKGSAG